MAAWERPLAGLVYLLLESWACKVGVNSAGRHLHYHVLITEYWRLILINMESLDHRWPIFSRIPANAWSDQARHVKNDVSALPDTPQIASPAGAHAGFEPANPVCPVLAQSGQRAGFDRACTWIWSGPTRAARFSPHVLIQIPPGARTGYARANHHGPWAIWCDQGLCMGKARPEPVWESTGLALARTNPMVARTNPAWVQSGLAIWDKTSYPVSSCLLNRSLI